MDASLYYRGDIPYNKLSHNESCHLIRLYQENKDPEVLKKLTEAYYPFIVKLASRYAKHFKGMDDDLHQVAFLGFERALMCFDTGRGFRFMTYAHRTIRTHLYRYATGQDLIRIPPLAYKRKNPEPPPRAHQCGVELRETVDHKCYVIEPNKKAWEECDFDLNISSLDERERMILRQRYVEELTLKEIGETHGITRERVRQIQTRALEKLRDANFKYQDR